MVTARRTPRLLVWMLALSVLANLFLAGVIIGRMQQRDVETADRVAAILGRSLSPDVRQAFRQTLARHPGELADAARAVRDARRQMFEALSREALDDAEMEAAFERMRRATTDAQRKMHEIMRETARSLPPGTRGAWQDRLRDRDD